MEKKVITGKWKIVGVRNKVQGRLEIKNSGIIMTFSYYGDKRQFKSIVSSAYCNDGSEGKVTIFGLRRKGSSYRTDSKYKEYTYYVEDVLIDQALKDDEQYFKQVTFSLDHLDRHFYTIIDEKLQKVSKNKSKVITELQDFKISQKTTNYLFEISYGSAITGMHSYDTYAYISLKFNKKVNLSVLKEYLQEVLDLFIFLTNDLQLPKNISVYNNLGKRSLPRKLIINRYLKNSAPSYYQTALFLLQKDTPLLKSIVKKWGKIFKKESLNFRLFSSELSQQNQYYDNTFFNVASAIDNLLISKYGKKLKPSLYSNLKYKYVQDKFSQKKRPIRSTLKDRLLLYISGLNYTLHPKLHGLLPKDLPVPPQLTIEEHFIDLIVNLRNDIAHGRDRRNGQYINEINMMAKFIALRLLLDILDLNPNDAKGIIDRLPLTYYFN